MWDSEKKHIATFDKIVTQHGVRPTFLYPVWKVAAFALGAGTAMMGPRTAMACTEAVETMIGEHYNEYFSVLPSFAHKLTPAQSAQGHLRPCRVPVNASLDRAAPQDSHRVPRRRAGAPRHRHRERLPEGTHSRAAFGSCCRRVSRCDRRDRAGMNESERSIAIRHLLSPYPVVRAR